MWSFPLTSKNHIHPLNVLILLAGFFFFQGLPLNTNSWKPYFTWALLEIRVTLCLNLHLEFAACITRRRSTEQRWTARCRHSPASHVHQLLTETSLLRWPPLPNLNSSCWLENFPQENHLVLLNVLKQRQQAQRVCEVTQGPIQFASWLRCWHIIWAIFVYHQSNCYTSPVPRGSACTKSVTHLQLPSSEHIFFFWLVYFIKI